MKIFLIRHGETEANAQKIHQYPNDSLSEEGIKQAEMVARRLLGYGINVVLSSPYQRSKQTTEIINKHLNKNIEFDDLLRELKRPSEIEGKPTQDEEVEKIKDIIAQNAHNPEFKFSDEENFFEFKKRALELLEQLSKRGEENILISTHGQVIVMLFCVMVFGKNLTSEEYYNLKSVLQLNNSGITLFNYSNNKWSLVTWNDIEHL